MCVRGGGIGCLQATNFLSVTGIPRQDFGPNNTTHLMTKQLFSTALTHTSNLIPLRSNSITLEDNSYRLFPFFTRASYPFTLQRLPVQSDRRCHPSRSVSEGQASSLCCLHHNVTHSHSKLLFAHAAGERINTPLISLTDKRCDINKMARKSPELLHGRTRQGRLFPGSPKNDPVLEGKSCLKKKKMVR